MSYVNHVYHATREEAEQCVCVCACYMFGSDASIITYKDDIFIIASRLPKPPDIKHAKCEDETSDTIMSKQKLDIPSCPLISTTLSE